MRVSGECWDKTRRWSWVEEGMGVRTWFLKELCHFMGLRGAGMRQHLKYSKMVLLNLTVF